jgi:HlyD family secretion protein
MVSSVRISFSRVSVRIISVADRPINLELGQPTESIIIPKGTFFQSTGGSWIFVLDPDGKKAYRRSIKIGRQNPQYYEVLEGLEAGEKVIVSSYESYKDNEVLVLE